MHSGYLCSAQKYPIMHCFSPLVDPEHLWSPYWAFGLVLPSVKVLAERKLHFFHSPCVSGSVCFPPLVFRDLSGPGVPPPVTGAPQAIEPSSVGSLKRCWVCPHSHPEPFYCCLLPLLHWELGVTWVHWHWEPHSLLLMEGLVKHSKQNPGAQRPNSAPHSTTSWTVKVICHILSQHFNSSSRVCRIDCSVCKGIRCSCAGLWADSDSWRVQANIRSLCLMISPSLLQFDFITNNCKGFSICMCMSTHIITYMSMSGFAVVWPLVTGGKHGSRLFLWLIVARCWGCGPDGLGAKW